MYKAEMLKLVLWILGIVYKQSELTMEGITDHLVVLQRNTEFFTFYWSEIIY